MNSTIFSLDIGTRSVVGTILQESNGKYEVLDLVTMEHQERSMIDGQIHNILTVAQVITNIKEQLEEKHGPLQQVSVAAAGRALLTEESELEVDLTEENITSTEDMNRLELAAVQSAQQKLLKKEQQTKEDAYYCVGYSVIHYTLDGQQIGNLIDQTGKIASVRVIATFLPQVVVESLLAALQHADLEMTALTLEPIAAIHVLVPPSMRKLNVALIDIGAGTSDIAIANNGTITAYGMVPLAGDEVTDALSQEYLVDFPIAEKVKRQLSTSETVEIEDILGFNQIFPSTDICTQIEPTVEKITQAIAKEIMRLNRGEAPKAVILVGGGSLTPNLSLKLSQALSLPEMRVAIRGLEALSGVTVSKDLGQSPELVTPIGIAIAAKNAPLYYMTVHVNEKPVRLFELKEMTVGDALIASNFSIEQMYGKPGRGMTITFNGKTLAIPGEIGRPSIIHVNGERANLKQTIKNGDMIQIEAGENGSDAKPTAVDLMDSSTPIQVQINNQIISLKPQIIINGQKQTSDAMIQDRDKVEIRINTTLQAALQKWTGKTSEQAFSLVIDKKPIRLKKWEDEYYLNKVPIRPTHHLQDQDFITVKTRTLPTVASLSRELEIPFTEKTHVFFNGENIQIEKPRYQIYINGEVASPTSSIQNGDKIEFVSLPNRPIVFSDVFAFSAYELPKNINGSYQLLRNDAPIQLNEQIFQGDRLEIKFQKDAPLQ